MKLNYITIRLGIAFSLLVGLLVSVGWLSLSRMARMNAEVEQIVEQGWSNFQLSHQALRYSSRNNRITMQIFLLKERKDIEPLLIERANNTEKISGLLNQIEGKAQSEEEKRLLRAVWTARVPYVDSYKLALSFLLDQEDYEKARQTMISVTLPRLVTYHDAWQSFVQYQGDEADRGGHAVELHFLEARHQIIWLLALSAIMGFTIAFIATRSLKNEIAIRERAQVLQQARDELELRVKERTHELRKANEGLEVAAVKLCASHRELQGSEQRFRTLCASAPIGIFLTGTAGEGLYSNPYCCKLTGLSSEQNIGDGWKRAIHPADAAGVVAAFEVSDREGNDFNHEFRFLAADGGVRWVHSRATPLFGETGDIIGRVGTVEDITQHKEDQAKLETIQNELMEASHQAGMAEVAAGVLHNVGNVLNSVNVASTCVADSLRRSKGANLAKVVALLREHERDLGAFLENDPKGKQVLGYLAQLADRLAGEQSSALKELANLQKNIEHIKEIVTMQQAHAKVSDTAEPIHVVELIEDALRINASALSRHHVQVVKEFEEVPPVKLQKHKLLQILINLIRNAKQACESHDRAGGQLALRLKKDTAHIHISVTDNGTGIAPEHLSRIFAHGFTTKKDGHGFGLRSATLAAQEMGGNLRVYSDGIGKGATFTLELPIDAGARNTIALSGGSQIAA